MTRQLYKITDLFFYSRLSDHFIQLFQCPADLLFIEYIPFQFWKFKTIDRYIVFADGSHLLTGQLPFLTDFHRPFGHMTNSRCHDFFNEKRITEILISVFISFPDQLTEYFPCLGMKYISFFFQFIFSDLHQFFGRIIVERKYIRKIIL